MEKSNGNLILYETTSKDHIMKLINVFESNADDYNLSTRKAKRANKKIIFRIWAYADKTTENEIRREVAIMEKPFAASF